MRTRFKKLLAGIGALVALALGGAAISQAGGSNPPHKSPEPAIEQEQSGSENSAADRDSVKDESGKDDAGEKSETGETSDKSEKADGAETGASEGRDDDG
jgi:hypothetical protein